MKTRSIFSDKFAANTFLAFIVVYMAWSGYKIISLNAYIPFDASLLIMLIPVILTDGIKTSIESLYPKKFFSPKEQLDKVTVVIPTYNGAKVIENTLRSLLRKFPAQSIIVASNGSTDNTRLLCESYGVRILDIATPIGKVEAINRALHLVTTPYTLILDDDTLLGDAIVPTNALDEGYQGVAFRVLPVKEGFWSQLQLHEYRKSMDVGRNYHNHTATVQNISGAIGLFKNSELMRQAKIHTGEFSGEDLQRTLLIHLAKDSGGVVIAESTVETVVPDTFISLFKQRVYGWYPGFLSNFTKYFRLVFKKNIPFRLRFEAFYNSFVLAALDPLRLITLPILLFNPTYLIFFYIVYIILESIPYFAMGRKEPFWVILIFPVYGIVNFIARILSMSVFFYRRITAKVGKANKLDDYKFVGVLAKLSGSVISSLASVLLIVSYLGFQTVALNVNKAFVPTDVSDGVISYNFKIHTVTDLPNNNAYNFYYMAKPGDSAWKISERAVEDYITKFGLEENGYQKNVFVYWVAVMSDINPIRENVTYMISDQILEEASNKARKLS